MERSGLRRRFGLLGHSRPRAVHYGDVHCSEAPQLETLRRSAWPKQRARSKTSAPSLHFVERQSVSQMAGSLSSPDAFHRIQLDAPSHTRYGSRCDSKCHVVVPSPNGDTYVSPITRPSEFTVRKRLPGKSANPGGVGGPVAPTTRKSGAHSLLRLENQFASPAYSVRRIKSPVPLSTDEVKTMTAPFPSSTWKSA